MKGYTDLEQSKKLAEILPLESADMYWRSLNLNGHISWSSHIKRLEPPIYDLEHYIPCWSLTSLLGQLKSKIRLENKQILFLHLNKYNDTDYEIRYTNSWTGEVFITEADNLVDACVEMIIKLHELKML